jgi:predicted nucleic acid-binding protein
VLVVDSSVWIDFFNDVDHPSVQHLARLLESGEVPIVVPDLVLFEVLRGFRDDRDHRRARLLLESLEIEPAAGATLALEAARHYRSLRAAGVTVRSAIDVLIATFCIERDYLLLHRDRDFDVFEQLRGLRSVRH